MRQRLLTVHTGRLPRWRGRTALVYDTVAHRYYVISTVASPWRDGPETLVYPTDAQGRIESVPGWGTGRLYFVAGGNMDRTEAVHDLTHRLIEGNLLSEEESAEMEAALMDQDIEAFSAYITPNRE